MDREIIIVDDSSHVGVGIAILKHLDADLVVIVSDEESKDLGLKPRIDEIELEITQPLIEPIRLPDLDERPRYKKMKRTPRNKRRGYQQ